MKKKWWIITIAVIVILGWIMAVVFSSKQSDQEKELSLTLSLPPNNHILQTQEIDIDKDQVYETVVLYGKKKSGDGVIADNINVAVVQPDTGFAQKTNLNSLKGFEPVMSTCDFTGDGKPDVLISVLTGADKGQTKNVVIDFSEPIPKNIFSEEDNNGVKMQVKLIDNFAIEAKLNGGQNFSINIAKDKDALIKEGIYDAAGKIKATNPTVKLLPYSLIQPADLDGDGKFELIGHQKIVVGSNQRELCTVISNQKYINNAWEIKKIEYSHMVKDL